MSSQPKKDFGRAAVRSTPICSRLTAEMMVARCENKADFEEMREAFEAEYHPVHPTEALYLDNMIAAAWRLRRCRRIEEGLYALRLNELEDRAQGDLDEHGRRDLLLHNDASGTVEKLLRCGAALKRNFDRARKGLLQLRSERARQQACATAPRPNGAKWVQ